MFIYLLFFCGFLAFLFFITQRFSKATHSSSYTKRPISTSPPSHSPEKIVQIIKTCPTREGEVSLMEDGSFHFSHAQRSIASTSPGVYEEEGAMIGGYLMNEKISISNFQRELITLITDNMIGVAAVSYEDQYETYQKKYAKQKNTDFLHLLYQLNQKRKFIPTKAVADIQYLFTKNISSDSKTIAWNPLDIQTQLQSFYHEHPQGQQLIEQVKKYVKGQEGLHKLKMYSVVNDKESENINVITQTNWNKIIDQALHK